MGVRPSFCEALRDLGFFAAIARGKPPSDAEFDAAWNAKSYRAAHPGFRRLSAQGHAQAQHELAQFFDFGRGCRKNQARALRLYELAARGGVMDAAVDAGLSYEHGEGVKPDIDAAIRWYELAAAADHPRALNQLGRIRREGDGLPKDLAEAERLFRKAIEGGNPNAEYNLATLLLQRDDASTEADRLLESAAEQGQLYAQVVLAKRRLRGDDTELREAALEELHRRANIGEDLSKEYLGDYLADCAVDVADQVRRFDLLASAVALLCYQGVARLPQLIEALESLRLSMTDEQLAAGRDAVVERLEGNGALILGHVYKSPLFAILDMDESNAWIDRAGEEGLGGRRYMGYNMFVDTGTPL